jgi:diguanylate cyclase (GGDEF)-like protein
MMGRIDDGPWPGVADTSGLTSRLMLAYAEREGGPDAVCAVLEAAGVAEHADLLLDERSWFPFAVKVRLFEALAEVLEDPAATRHAGAAALELNVATGLKVALRALGSPRLVYQQIIRANGKFSARHAMETLELGRESARIAFSDLGGEPVHPLDCQYNIGLLSCVPAIFGRPPARVTHTTCAARGADACVYDVAWDRQALPLRSALGAGAVAAASVGGALVLAPALLPEALVVAAGAGFLASGRAIATLTARTRHLEVELDEREAIAGQLMGSLQDLAGELRVEELLDKIIDTARAAVAGKHFALLLEDGGRLRCRGATGLSNDSIAALEGWADDVARDLAAPAVVDDVSVDPRLAPLGEDPLRPLRTVCAAPLRYRGAQTGLLCALAGGARTFLPTDAELVESYATQAAIALGNAEQFALQRELASRDPLTGLHNHREFHEALAREIARCRRHGGTVSVVLVDLDGFKAVNDGSGHGEGDRLLRATGAAIVTGSRESDSAFRIGGDEFAVILPHSSAEDASMVAERIAGAIADLDTRVGASYGLATWPDHGGSKDVLLAHADASLYDMKSRVQGRSGRRELDSLFDALPNPTYLWRADGDDLVLERFNAAASEATGGRAARLIGSRATELYADAPDVVADLRRCAQTPGRVQREMSYVLRATGERRELIVVYGQVRPGLVAVHTLDVTDGPDGGARDERAGWEKLVGRAIADERLLAYSQPIVPLADGLEPHEELLVRLRDEGGNVLAPGAFLPHAERVGIVGTIDRWMIDRALEAARAGRRVHVNLSARSLEDRGIVDFVTRRLAATGAEASRVTFEITETAAVASLADAVEVAAGLSALGCELALDDFGTGYAPLAYLAELPVSYIKIDMSFVHGLLARERDERVVRSIVRTAGEFGLRTVAEGVEDAATLERLRTLGVDYAQGYHLGRPAPCRFDALTSGL